MIFCDAQNILLGWSRIHSKREHLYITSAPRHRGRPRGLGRAGGGAARSRDEFLADTVAGGRTFPRRGPGRPCLRRRAAPRQNASETNGCDILQCEESGLGRTGTSGLIPRPDYTEDGCHRRALSTATPIDLGADAAAVAEALARFNELTDAGFTAAVRRVRAPTSLCVILIPLPTRPSSFRGCEAVS